MTAQVLTGPLIFQISDQKLKMLGCQVLPCKAHNRLPHLQSDSAASNDSPVKGLWMLEPVYHLYTYYQYTQINLPRAPGLEVRKETNHCEIAISLALELTQLWLSLPESFSFSPLVFWKEAVRGSINSIPKPAVGMNFVLSYQSQDTVAWGDANHQAMPCCEWEELV